MSKDKDLADPAPDLPRSADELPTIKKGHDGKGRFTPGNREGVQFKRRNRANEKHGLRTRKRSAIDRRRAVDRRVLATIEAVEEALAERLSPQRRLILAGIGRRLRALAKMEAYEEEHGLFDRRRHSVTGVTEAKLKLLEQIDRALERLGLDVVKRSGPALGAVMQRYAAAGGVDEPEPELEPDDHAATGDVEPSDALEVEVGPPGRRRA